MEPFLLGVLVLLIVVLALQLVLPAGATRCGRTCDAICLRATASRSARAPHSTCALHIAPRRKVGRLLVASEPKLGRRSFGTGRKSSSSPNDSYLGDLSS